MQRKYLLAPSPTILKKLFKANEELAAQCSVNKHTISGLCKTVINEKKKHKRGKRLNLLGENDVGPQFFSPQQVQAARDYQASKEAEEAQRQQDISDRKVLAATNKQLKEEEKLQRAELAAQKQLVKAAEKQAQKELKDVLNIHHGMSAELPSQFIEAIQAPKTPKRIKKRIIEVVPAQKVEVVRIEFCKNEFVFGRIGCCFRLLGSISECFLTLIFRLL